jgi:hypothetical protein
MKRAITATELAALVLLSGCGSSRGLAVRGGDRTIAHPSMPRSGLPPSAQHDLEAAAAGFPRDLTFGGEVTSRVRMAVNSRPVPSLGRIRIGPGSMCNSGLAAPGTRSTSTPGIPSIRG